MSMGKRQGQRQEELWIPAAQMPRAPGHPFYQRLNQLLARYGFDVFVESRQVNSGDPIRFASDSARKLNEFAFDWIDKNDSWPNFMYVHSVDPHEEYEPAPEYLERFADPQRMDEFNWDKCKQCADANDD